MADYDVPETIASGTQEGPGAAARTAECACLCGETVNPRSTFLQGHDQRFVGQLAQDVVDGTLTSARIEQLQLSAEVNGEDIQERINHTESAVVRYFSPALAAKSVSAAHRRWAKAGKGKPVDVDRAVAIAEDLATKPPQTLAQIEEEYAIVPGASVKVKVGRWQYDATVHGMSQAGKVTAVRYDTAGGKEVVKTEGQFTIV